MAAHCVGSVKPILPEGVRSGAIFVQGSEIKYAVIMRIIGGTVAGIVQLPWGQFSFAYSVTDVDSYIDFTEMQPFDVHPNTREGAESLSEG